MRIPKGDFVDGTSCSPYLRRLLSHTDFIISLRALNNLHKVKPHGPIDISMIKTPDFIRMLRQTRDHRGELVYKDANIYLDSVSHISLRNYQTYASLQKIGSIYKLNEFFAECDHTYSLATTGLLLVRCKIDSIGYAAFYVPPIVEYQNKQKIIRPLERLKIRAAQQPTVQLPSFDGNGTLQLQPIIDDWIALLSSSQQAVPILKDGTHRCYTTTLAGTPALVVKIDETDSLMQSVPVETRGLVITRYKPKDREDRFLGVLRLPHDRWEGWVDLARGAGIDG
jgi:hypothetical protein